ncbi:hypothetical protein CGMCC3_g10757 [Colletotrichum fructicola]|nr:uncharacterized protein CGMCC3_g10757 [Colletotrichum fructicola]KAE9573303.1 hypothetical protein CGMCC3_g10757 [Colletotrichum fructicola]
MEMETETGGGALDELAQASSIPSIPAPLFDPSHSAACSSSDRTQRGSVSLTQLSLKLRTTGPSQPTNRLSRCRPSWLDTYSIAPYLETSVSAEARGGPAALGSAPKGRVLGVLKDDS